MSEPVGITYYVPAGQEALGVYEDDRGIEVFETEMPYHLSDGKSFVLPTPIVVVESKVFIDSLGNARDAIPVKFNNGPVDGITWDSGQTWDSGTYWSSN